MTASELLCRVLGPQHWMEALVLAVPLIGSNTTNGTMPVGPCHAIYTRSIDVGSLHLGIFNLVFAVFSLLSTSLWVAFMCVFGPFPLLVSMFWQVPAEPTRPRRNAPVSHLCWLCATLSAVATGITRTRCKRCGARQPSVLLGCFRFIIFTAFSTLFSWSWNRSL